MTSVAHRRVRLPSLAKLNLDLRVLYKRPDGFHELRSIFQTISLRDTITVQLEPAKKAEVSLNSSVDIPDNIVLRAARLILDQLGTRVIARFTLTKRIPMGAGLGGGSSNAAAVLIGLPALLGKRIDMDLLLRMAEALGSDVPFFLRGGTALALGRGTELYPLPELPPQFGLVIASGIHVSTPAAYLALRRDFPAQTEFNAHDGLDVNSLTSTPESHILREFQSVAWSTAGVASGSAMGKGLKHLPFRNDFEDAVFDMHPGLVATATKLVRLGAKPVRMTGSGSAIFGIFPSETATKQAALKFPAATAFPVRFISRRRYLDLWRRALGPLAEHSCFSE